MSSSSSRNMLIEIDYDNPEASKVKYLIHLCGLKNKGQEPPSPTEPPVERCERLENIALRSAEGSGDDCSPRIFEKPKVCRRINFNHPDDLERRFKEAIVKATLMLILSKQRQLQLKKNEELESAKRTREDDEMANVVTKRPATRSSAKRLGENI